MLVISNECKDTLSVYLRTICELFPHAKTSGALFLGRNKAMTIIGLEKVVKTVAGNSGIGSDVTCHTFRRIFCTEF